MNNYSADALITSRWIRIAALVIFTGIVTFQKIWLLVGIGILLIGITGWQIWDIKRRQ